MRIPIAIVMLCLPMAAMGETYVCRTDRASYLFPNDGSINQSPKTDWVIDLDDDYSDIGPGIEQMSRMQLPPEILDENYGGRIDNSMWLKNVMGGDS